MIKLSKIMTEAINIIQDFEEDKKSITEMLEIINVVKITLESKIKSDEVERAKKLFMNKMQKDLQKKMKTSPLQSIEPNPKLN